MVDSNQNRYELIMEAIFRDKHHPDQREIDFTREEITSYSEQLGVDPPKNLGDLVYSFRYRIPLPRYILNQAPDGETWIIRPTGQGKYRLVLVTESSFEPNMQLAPIKIPDATPGIISKYAFNDEQAVLTRIRYNRLIDVFLGITSYSLQNHLRATVPNIGQVETDELYVGLDKHGIHYVVPIQAKSERDRLGRVQIEQDFALCASKLPSLICRPVGAHFIMNDVVVLFEFIQMDDKILIADEKHYRLVPPDNLTEEELARYRARRPT